MGNYTHMRGIVQIKPELINILRPRFTMDKEYKVVSWKDIDFPLEIKQSKEYQDILANIYYCDWVPGPFESRGTRTFLGQGFQGIKRDFWPKLEYSESGVLKFYCSMKNYDKQQEQFLAFIPLIAESWEIEQDLNDCRYECSAPSSKYIRHFKSGK